MDPLKKKFQEKSGAKRDELKQFIKDNADVQVDTVKLSQVTGGMRGIKCIGSVRGHQIQRVFHSTASRSAPKG